MSRFSRLRSDGALSIDLGEAMGGPARSNAFARNDHEVVVPALNHSSTQRSSDIYPGNVSSSTTTNTTLTSPRPRIPASSTEKVEFHMEERLSLEEEWRILRECTFNPNINPRSRYIVASVRGEVDDGIYASTSQRRGSQQIFQKLYDEAKEQREKLERLRAAKEAAEEEKERREMQPEYTSSPGISPRRKPRGSKDSPDNNADNQENNNDNDNDNVADKEVFERLYADASSRRRVRAKGILKHQEEKKNRDKEEMGEEEEETLSPERRQGQSQNEEAPKMTEAERKEFFARLSVPIRKREKGIVTIHEEVTPRWGDDEESRRSSLQWPLPFLQPLTLADLERHNDWASQQLSRVVS